MKKVVCFVLVVMSFMICSLEGYANLDTIENGDSASSEETSGSDTNTNTNGSDSNGGGNNIDASWENTDPIVPGSSECSTIFKKSDGSFNEFGEFVQDIFTLIKFAAPVMVIAFSTIDYVKAISAQNADELKKANGRFVKRLVAGVAVFLLPFILDFIFDIFGLYGLDTCGIR